MVLKDFRCQECGRVEEHTVERDTEQFQSSCQCCDHTVTFISCCNGGTRTLPYGINLENRDWGDSCRFMGFEAEKTDGSPMQKGLLERVNDKERWAENKEKLRFKKSQRQGTGKLFFGA